MTTLKGHNFLIYFANTSFEGKVRCKLCNKNLKSKRLFNLKNHLKFLHQLEFSPTKRVSTKKQKKTGSNEIGLSSFKIAESSSLQNKPSDNLCHISTANLTTVDSLSGDSCSVATITAGVIKIEEEFIQEGAQIRTEDIEGGTTFEVNNSDDDIAAETTSTQNRLSQPLPSDDFVEPSARSWKNIRGFKEPNLLTDYNQRSKQKRSPPLPEDPLDENTSSSKNENFEQWINKKKQVLEIEVLEMRNYKIKLELWEKEQQLNIKCSKYTRDIEKIHQ